MVHSQKSTLQESVDSFIPTPAPPPFFFSSNYYFFAKHLPPHVYRHSMDNHPDGMHATALQGPLDPFRHGACDSRDEKLYLRSLSLSLVAWVLLNNIVIQFWLD